MKQFLRATSAFICHIFGHNLEALTPLDYDYVIFLCRRCGTLSGVDKPMFLVEHDKQRKDQPS